MKLNQEKLLHRNAMAVFGWSFIGLWMSMLLLFTSVYFNGGDKYLELKIPLIVFWVAGPLATLWFFKKPIISVFLNRAKAQVIVVERYLFKTQKHTFSFDEIKNLEIAEDKDSEGSPYYKCQIEVNKASNPRSITLIEGHSKEVVLEALNEIKKQL
jgi:hypothetical protein